ncbi:MAG: DEAD/DEAH box helicase family protein [Bacteroidota bacterium]
MSNIREIHFEDTVFELLAASNLYTIRKSENFNLEYVLDTALLEQFIKEAQPDVWKKLEKQFPTDTIEAVANEFSKLRDKRGILNLIREGFVLQGASIKLIAFKPASGLNPEHLKKYQANRFSIIRQVHYSSAYPEKSLDLVICINGIPIITLELKNEFTGQNVTHAVEQYCKRRDAKDSFLKNCLVHFAVDNNTVLMTTKLDNGNTRFLPFNRDTHNPVIANKFASSYLWEEVLQADSLLELLNNYIFNEEDEKTKEIKTIFPRYHQRDCVREILKDVKEKGTGHNYLIQHSAGSGKSKTIAWLAHQLSNLFGDNQQPIFDSIIVITDRIVLDKQLQKQIKQFEKINGTVRTITKGSKQLIKALTEGDKIIISTLQKFGYIGELAQLNGKRFAIIVDEAHSSQSGENVKDLKISLTTDEALKHIIKEDDENAEPKDTVEKELEKIMASRQKLPHLSFFAFTATPKPKTLELFGIPDASQKSGYRAFHEYSMRQAIEEGFILNLLDNYITKSAYFELIENENAEDDKAFEKLKAKRLLLKEVNKHPFAIASKSHIMLNHFMEKTIHKIGGRAKAMLVTSSRAHAVLYKIAFDKIIKEQGFDIQTLVAFSGTVEIEPEKYTEDSMNGPKIKDIAEEFKKPANKILIVANKFQTGFDQPLLHTMYVDKSLGGVATVQTLSRLNRTIPGMKSETFIIDFVNKQEDIQSDFQNYYQSTTLDQGTDKQKLYNLKYEIEKTDVFTKEDVLYFIEMFVRKKVKSEVLSPFFKKIVDENYVPLSADDKDKFRKNINKYVRQYSFISQIITFIDTDLEKFYLFTKLLFKYLPYEKETLPLEVTQMVDMDKYKIQEEENGSIILNPEDAVLENPQGDGHGGKQIDPKVVLEIIVKEINEKYAVELGDDDKVVKDMYEALKADKTLRASMLADNIEDVKRMKLRESIDKALLKNAEPPIEFMNRLSKDKGLANYLVGQLYHLLLKDLKDNPNIKYNSNEDDFPMAAES